MSELFADCPPPEPVEDRLRRELESTLKEYRRVTAENVALRDRVAQLEAALKHAQEYMRPNSLLVPGPSFQEMLDAALKDAPE